MRGVLVGNVPMSPWQWVQSQATLVWPSLYQGVILSFQLRWSFTILITEVKYVKINWKKYQIFWFLKNKCLLGTIVCCSRTGQMLGSSSEDLSIYLIMKLFTTFQFGIIFISYWFGWTHITVLYFKRIYGHSQTSWSSQSTIKASVTCLVGQLQSTRGRLWQHIRCKLHCKNLMCIL